MPQTRKKNRIPAKKLHVGVTPPEESRLRRHLRQKAPSEPWIDAQFRTLTDTTPAGQPITCRLHEPHLFPPGGPKTAMKYCRSCGRYTPPNSLHLLERAPNRTAPPTSSTLQCDDCHIAAEDPSHKNWTSPRMVGAAG